MADHDFNALVKKAVAAFNAMSPEEQAAHREAQRQSWVRGETGMGESAAMVKPMTDPTDRQRAEAKAREFFRDLGWASTDNERALFLEYEQRTRSEGWEAGREAAAKWHDEIVAMAHDNGARCNHRRYAAAIRTLPTPEEK